MKKIIEILKSISFLGFILILFLIYSRTIFPAKRFEKIEAPDLKVYYNSEQLYKMFDKMDSKAIETYKKEIITLDILYPIIYGLLFISLILVLGNKLNISEKKLNLIIFIPLISIIFDIIENISNFYIISNLPQRIGLASFSGFFTLIKWLSIFISLLIILYYSIMLLLKRLKESSRVQ